MIKRGVCAPIAIVRPATQNTKNGMALAKMEQSSILKEWIYLEMLLQQGKPASDAALPIVWAARLTAFALNAVKLTAFNMK